MGGGAERDGRPAWPAAVAAALTVAALGSGCSAPTRAASAGAPAAAPALATPPLPAPAPVTPSASATAPAPVPAPAPSLPAITLAFGGDVHFERGIRARLDRDPGTALGPIAATLRAADLAVVNLETAVTTRGTPLRKSFVFRAPPSALTALRSAGVDVASLANNHGVDYGREGLLDALAAARTTGLPVVGAGVDEQAAHAAHHAVVKGVRVAVLAANDVPGDNPPGSWPAGPQRPGLASAQPADRLLAAVRHARRDADTVVVVLHWGQEGRSCPTARQRALAGALAGAGADVVVGSHAHVQLGGGWSPGGAYVDYGLGNFVFYKDGVRPSTESGVLTLTVRGRRVSAAAWTPARITGGIPLPARGADARRLAAGKERLRGCTDLRDRPPR